jgi:hypothetical protein
VIIYDRDNPNPLSIRGNGAPALGGGVYLPNGAIDFNGSSCLVINNGSLIAKDVVKANGDKACVTVNSATNAGTGKPRGPHLTR